MSDKTNIMKDIKSLISNFFSQPVADSFINELMVDVASNQQPLMSEGMMKSTMLNYDLPSGIEYRLLVDGCITKCQRLLPENKFFDMSLELSRIIHAAGENDLSLEVAEDILAKTENKPGFDMLRADTNLMISKIYWSQAYWDDCSFYVEEARKLFTSCSSKSGIGKCENMLGTLYGEKGDIRLAQVHFENALAYLEEEDNILSRSMILTNLGIINTIQGDYEKAIWNYKNALQKFDMLKNTRCLSRTFHNIGMLYTRMEKYDAALDEFNKCITLSLENNYLSNCAVAYIGKAFIYTKLRNSALADAYTDKAMEIACRINDTLSIADIYKIKGMVHGDMENFQLSEEMFENSIRLNLDIESKLNEAESSIEMGKLLKNIQREEESVSYFQSAVNYFKDLKDKNLIAGLVQQYS